MQINSDLYSHTQTYKIKHTHTIVTNKNTDTHSQVISAKTIDCKAIITDTANIDGRWFTLQDEIDQ